MPNASPPLKLYFHPLASFCQKVLVALYEKGAEFEPVFVDLGDPASSAELRRLWPVGKFPLLHDLARGRAIPESSIIIEYLDRHYPGRTRFIPEQADRALQTRLRDRFYDLYLHLPMQKIVGDRLRPADKKDPHGVAEARAQLRMSGGGKSCQSRASPTIASVVLRESSSTTRQNVYTPRSPDSGVPTSNRVWACA